MEAIERKVSNEIVNINLGGDEKIGLDSLIETLEAARRGMKELAEQLYDPRVTTVNIYVEPFNRGSFDINIAIQVSTIVGGLSPVLIPLGKAFFKTIFVRKKVKGDESNVTFSGKNNIYIVHTGSGDINLEPEIYQAMTKTKAYESETSSLFKSIDKDKTRTDLKITVNDGVSEPIQQVIKKEEFVHLGKPLNLSKNLIEITQDVNRVWLTVETAKFTEGKDNWSFGFNGDIFDARIIDSNFLEQIEAKRVFFGKGTQIECDLEITSIKEPGRKTKITRLIGKVHSLKQSDNVTIQSFDL